jgi:hypothetical protein
MNAFQKEKSDAALKKYPHLAELRNLLLSMGGELVCDWNENNNNDELTVSMLTACGLLWPTRNMKTMKGEPNGCHDNAARQQLRYPNRYRVITGFALYKDGLWRPHSWAFDFVEGRIADTTYGRAVKYFGFPARIRGREVVALM